jgi:hypothetical protein
MDYAREIERLQKAQQKAAAAPPMEFPAGPIAGISLDTHDTAPSTDIEGNPSANPTDANHDSDLDLDSDIGSNELPDTSEPDVPTERVMAAASQGVSVGMLIPVAILLWFAWSGVDDAWDGYYLRPFQALFVLVPLGMVVAVLSLRHLLLQKLKFLQTGSLTDAKHRMVLLRRSLTGTKQRISNTMRWLPKALMALALVSFASMFLMPRGLPLGQWLGLTQPVEADAAIAGAATDTAIDAVADAATFNRTAPTPSANEAVAMDAAKPADSSVAPNAPQRVGEPSTLLDAVEDGNLKAVKKLIAQEQNVNVRYPDGHTAAGMTLLHVAAGDEDSGLAITQALIKAGAKVDAPSTSGRYKGLTPLHAALFGDHAQIVQLLLQRGARMDAADDVGWQALHYAANLDASKSLPLLILAAKQQKVSVDVPATGTDGETALMRAAGHNFLEGITLLAKAGASLSLPDNTGKTALDHAISSRHAQAVRLLCDLDDKPLRPNAASAIKKGNTTLGC